MYLIEEREKEKILMVKAEGGLTVEEGQQFVKDLLAKFSKINPSNYSLVLDGEKVSTSSQEVLPLIEQANGICLSAPFKQKFMILSKSAVANMQLKRLGKDSLFSQLELVNSYEEVLEKLK